ncbi:MAG: hypothetical protein K6F53_06475 [Lachnospiraceae bacterium]|nr:hypothetical protein [Lachnospiraceae bacterium]
MLSVKRIPQTGIIRIPERSRLLLGSAFHNDIFYQTGALIRPEHARIFYEEGRLFFSAVTSDGLSVNPKTGEPKRFLKKKEGVFVLYPEYGDEIRIFGLALRFFGKYLFADAYYGDLRIAKEEGRDPSAAYG